MLRDAQQQRKPRSGLPTIPARMATLPLDHRGYPVPWFVEWIDGEPDFRVMDRRKWARAVKFGNCWLCGEMQGRHKTFVIGPMCAINRTTSEPACHIGCAEFAATACPFMTLPAAQYRSAELPAGHIEAAGHASKRNPGVTCLWTTDRFDVFNVDTLATGGVPGQLIRIGEPSAVSWFALAKRASREQVEESIEGGFPALLAAATSQNRYAVAELLSMRAQFTRWLPA
jgi:hypothetical protein